MDQTYQEHTTWAVYRPGQLIELFTLISVPGTLPTDPQVPTEPGSATLTIIGPDGSPEERVYPGPQISMPSDGDMRSLYSAPDLAGWYWWRWASDAPQTAAEGVFEVRRLGGPAQP